MGAGLRFQGRLAAELDSAMAEKGFYRANNRKIESILSITKKRPWVIEPLIHDNERIYVLNRDNGKPIFAAFVLVDEGKDTVSVLASNPSEAASAGSLTSADQYFRRTYSEKNGNPANIAETITAELSALANLKTAHRMQIHFHSGRMLDGSSPHDDGVSDIASSIRRALLHHVDVFVYTPHNSFEMSNSKHMVSVLDEFGMVAPIAGELTMPLMDDHPSGPHHIVVVADPKIGFGMVGGILISRDRSLRMPSYFTGMTIDKMYEALEPFRERNYAIVGLAHPVNFNSTTLPISGVGLFSSVQHGHISFDQAMAFAAQNDFIESWNDSLYMGQMSFESPEFRTRMLGLLAEHGTKLGIPDNMKLSTNLCNILLAADLKAKFGLGQSFGSDAHTEAPLRRDYQVGGDWFSRGWTTLAVPEAMQSHKISAEEFVRGISRKEITMAAVAFTEIKDQLVRIVDSRMKRPKDVERIIAQQNRKVTTTYAYELAKDFANFLAHGHFKDIRRMSE